MNKKKIYEKQKLIEKEQELREKELLLKEKELQKVDIIFIASLFKRKKTYLGFNKFKLLTKLTKKKIIALGGINKNNLKKINLLNIYGYSGINLFNK